MAIKKKKSSFDFLVFLFIVAIALGSYSSYSKYTSSVSGSSSVNVAAWSVEVNSDDITDDGVVALSQNISFTPISSQYVAAGKMAPSVGGYFDVIIDTRNAEVASTYTINIDVTDLSSLGGFNVVGYEVYGENQTLPTSVTEIPNDLSEVTESTANEHTYKVISSGVLTLDANGKGAKETVRVYLEWDGEDGTNPDSATVQIPVGVTVEQYFG